MSAGDLFDRARQNSEGPQGPAEWGSPIMIEIGEHWGPARFRGTGSHENFNSPAYLFWGPAGEECYLLGSARLERGLRDASVGDTVAIYRGENYETQYDRSEGREPSGLGYGVALEPNPAPLPEAKDDFPF